MTPRDPHSRAARRTPRLLPWVVVCLVVLAVPCGAQTSAQPVKLLLQWQHQSQFAGYYMALAKNFYASHGLEVQLLRGGPDVRAEEVLRAGQADFASLMLCTALNKTREGLPLVHMAQVVNRSNFLLVAWRESAEGDPIRELSNLNGRKVTLWDKSISAAYQALFASKNLAPVILPQYNTFSLFLHRGADAFSAMRYNEYHTLQQSGISEEEVRVFSLRDFGFDVPEDGLYCLAGTWERRQAVCTSFIRASFEGWRYARDHTEETLDVVMEYVNQDQLPTNRAHMRWMLKEILASVFPQEKSAWTVGRLSRPAYEEALKTLGLSQDLEGTPSYDRFVVGDEANALE